MSTNANKTATSESKGEFWALAGLLSSIVTTALIRSFTDWSWWAYGAPFAAISALILGYYWVKNRRSERD